MSGASSTKKGKALEKAVGAIEAMVFKNQPDLVGRNVTIRANKRLDDRGVHHEIDVIVYVDEGTAQQAIHAYECKNRKAPADKNDVIVFAHKMRILKAATGTVVAAKFTSDARAQAAQEPAIRLFTFTQDFWTCVDQFEWVATSYDVGTAKTTAHYRYPHPTERILTADSACLFNGRPTTLLALARSIMDEHFIGIRKSNELAALEGLHSRHTATSCEFDPGELMVDGHDVQYLSLDIPYLVSVRHARLVAKFNVHTRGGHYEFACEKDPFEGKVFSVEITTKPV
jgi:hypothetical protein